ncbi:MAG TPA: 4Fe-4S ferredoxin [Candidatus Limnocylindria bacterium]|nr:4Fe-4S ferredoxin [Candidatus Limnocylindria bacterium]
MYAVRNIRLCTKDCLCLFVCPTGATDTDNGQIDAAKCLDSCRACVDACPSKAISLAPTRFPRQQEKQDVSVNALRALGASKGRQELAARNAAKNGATPAERQLGEALRMSLRIQAEDMAREAGFMIPQSENAIAYLRSLLDAPQPEGFPREAAERLLAMLEAQVL